MMTGKVIFRRRFENWKSDDGGMELVLVVFPLILGFLWKVFPPVT